MAKVSAELIWFNGELIPWENATVHVMSHAPTLWLFSFRRH